MIVDENELLPLHIGAFVDFCKIRPLRKQKEDLVDLHAI